jgi:hypothetical protein
MSKSMKAVSPMLGLPQIRIKLAELLKSRGELKSFCINNDISYNYAYRVAKGTIVNISHTRAVELNNALSQG